MSIARRLAGAGGWAFWGWTALASMGVALFSYRYIPMAGPLADPVLENPFSASWLQIHAASAATALLIGSFQLIPALRRRVPGAHRWMGRLYAACCLAGGVSGLLLALGSTAGPIATAGFGALALVWLFTTIQAWRLAMQRRFADHRAWMIRSWALTLAGVTFRIDLLLIPMLGLSFVDGYRISSWLCWVGNIAAAEIYLRLRPRPG
jgi:uncharacterized membrane protein